MRRLVIDANTLASGCVDPHASSPPSLLYRNLASTLFEAIVCPELVAELRGALNKPYFAQRLDEADITDIVDGICDAATVLPDPLEVQPLLRDPADDYLLALAREANAEAIVSGDNDLLAHEGITPPAITPRQACERLDLIDG